MITLKVLIDRLKTFPPDAMCYAYEGEITGIIIVEPKVTRDQYGGEGRKEIGAILMKDGNEPEED